MDNRTVDIISEGQEHMKHALSLVFGRRIATHFVVERLAIERKYYARAPVSDRDVPNIDHNGTKLCVWHSETRMEKPDGVPTLILLTGNSEVPAKINTLPFPLDEAKALAFVMGWLESGADYGRPPDHDGDSVKGWRAFTDDWGHVRCYRAAIIGIQPVWATYGK